MAEDSKGVLPELGMAAAAFASLLVVVSMPSPSDELRRAVAIFAISIPVVIAGAFVSILSHNGDGKWVSRTLTILRYVCLVVGDVGCGIGIYWVFAHVSATAGRRFVTSAIICWVVIGVLGAILGCLRRKSAK